MTLAEACALAQEIARDERVPWQVNKVQRWNWPAYAINVSLMNTPTAGIWITSREDWDMYGRVWPYMSESGATSTT